MLHEATRFGHLSVVKIMLEKEEDLALACNNLGETPLYVAVAAGKKDVYDFVKQKLVGKDKDATRRNDGSCLLHAAVVAEYYGKIIKI